MAQNKNMVDWETKKMPQGQESAVAAPASGIARAALLPAANIGGGKPRITLAANADLLIDMASGIQAEPMIYAPSPTIETTDKLDAVMHQSVMVEQVENSDAEAEIVNEAAATPSPLMSSDADAVLSFEPPVEVQAITEPDVAEAIEPVAEPAMPSVKPSSTPLLKVVSDMTKMAEPVAPAPDVKINAAAAIVDPQITDFQALAKEDAPKDVISGSPLPSAQDLAQPEPALPLEQETSLPDSANENPSLIHVASDDMKQSPLNPFAIKRIEQDDAPATTSSLKARFASVSAQAPEPAQASSFASMRLPKPDISSLIQPADSTTDTQILNDKLAQNRRMADRPAAIAQVGRTAPKLDKPAAPRPEYLQNKPNMGLQGKLMIAVLAGLFLLALWGFISSLRQEAPLHLGSTPLASSTADIAESAKSGGDLVDVRGGIRNDGTALMDSATTTPVLPGMPSRSNAVAADDMLAAPSSTQQSLEGEAISVTARRNPEVAAPVVTVGVVEEPAGEKRQTIIKDGVAFKDEALDKDIILEILNP